MPVFADVIPELDLPIEWITPTSVSMQELGYTLLKAWWALLLIIFLAFLAYWIVCLWKIFKKAGLPWRGSLIPFYREYLWFKMIWWNGRRTATMLSPFMFAIVIIISYFKTAEKFWKDKEQFWLWLWLLHPIFLWILAFDQSKYQPKK